MMVVLPRPTTRSSIYCISISYRMFGRLQVSCSSGIIKKYCGIAKADRLLVINDGYRFDGKKFVVSKHVKDYSFISAKDLKQILLKYFYFMIVEEPRYWNVKEAFRLLKFACPWLRYAYFVTNNYVAVVDGSSKNLTSRRYILSGQIVVFLS